jgi:hypothetical protein
MYCNLWIHARVMVMPTKIGPLGSVRINTTTSQPRTSSNNTFQEHFRSGIGSGLNLANSALKQIAKPIPGGAALSASLSDAARSLSINNKFEGGLSASSANIAPDSDPASLQDEMLRTNEDMLEQQMRVAQITTSYSTRSYILKALFDALKTIGSNIR